MVRAGVKHTQIVESDSVNGARLISSAPVAGLTGYDKELLPKRLYHPR